MSLLIKNVGIPGRLNKADCFVEHGKIVAIEDVISHSADEVVNGAGLTLLPGMIDVHVHLRVPGNPEKEDWITGSAAAIAGGVTTVCDMPNTNPAVTLASDVASKDEHMNAQMNVNAHSYIGATTENLQEVIDSEDLACGVKVYWGSTTGPLTMNDPAILEQLMAAGLKMPIVIHAEDDAIIAQETEKLREYHGSDIHSKARPPEAAASALNTILSLVKKTGAKNVHITHMTTAGEVDMIRAAKADGVHVTCDVTPHHLAFSVDDYDRLGTRLKVNPPVRNTTDVAALWAALTDGTVDMVASDHAPHLLAEKDQDYWSAPSGVPGLETSLPFLLDRVGNGFSLERLIEVTSTAPAKRFGLEDRGEIAVGKRADVTLVDLTGKTKITNDTIQSKCGWSPWDGVTFRGSIEHVIVGGKIVKE